MPGAINPGGPAVRVFRHTQDPIHSQRIMQYQRFSITNQQGIHVVTVIGSQLSDLMLQNEFFDEIMHFIEHEQPRSIVVDLSNVVYCNTGFIETLIALKRKMDESGGRLRLCALSDHLRETFQILNLPGTVFPIDNTVADAVAALEPQDS